MSVVSDNSVGNDKLGRLGSKEHPHPITPNKTKDRTPGHYYMFKGEVRYWSGDKLIDESKTINFIEKANKKHNNKFDYSKTEYINAKTKVTIICPIHREFQQTPNDHLKGQGCPDCVNKTEGVVLDFLLNNKSNFEIKTQYKPDWCKNPDTGRHLPYDFYIELSNGKKIIIECDGIQHYEETSHFHRNDWTLEKQQDRDIFKMNKALENDVSVIRIHQEDVYNDRINWKNEK